MYLVTILYSFIGEKHNEKMISQILNNIRMYLYKNLVVTIVVLVQNVFASTHFVA
jgi:hypothetical protein